MRSIACLVGTNPGSGSGTSRRFMEMHHRVEFIRFWSIPAVRIDALARAYANSRLDPKLGGAAAACACKACLHLRHRCSRLDCKSRGTPCPSRHFGIRRPRKVVALVSKVWAMRGFVAHQIQHQNRLLRHWLLLSDESLISRNEMRRRRSSSHSTRRTQRTLCTIVSRLMLRSSGWSRNVVGRR